MNRILAVCCLTFGFLSSYAFADEPELPLPVETIKRTDPVDYATEILPLLKKNCLACHHQQEANGGLVLETLEAIKQGGDSGPGIVAGDASKSLVFTRARGVEEPLMPPPDNEVGAKPLSPAELGLLQLWIQQGAKGQDPVAMDSIEWQPIPDTVRSVYALDMSPDGQVAAIAHANRVHLVDLNEFSEVARLADPDLPGSVADVDMVQSIAFDPLGRRVATGGFRTVRIWNQGPKPLDPQWDAIRTAHGVVSAQSDGALIAWVNPVGDIEIWNRGAEAQVHVLRGHADPIVALAWAPAAQQFASCDVAGLVHLWDVAQGRSIASHQIAAMLTDLAMAPGGKILAATDQDGHVHVMRLEPSTTGKPEDETSSSEPVAMTLHRHTLPEIEDANAVAIGGEPLRIVVASESKGMLVFDTELKLQSTIKAATGCDAIAITSDGSRSVAGMRDGSLKVFSLSDGKELMTLSGDVEEVLKLGIASRDAGRQKAAVERLTKQTEELEKRLASETEALKKVTEERDKAIQAVADLEKKHQDATQSLAATKTQIDSANQEAAAADKLLTSVMKDLEKAKLASTDIAKTIQTQKVELATVEKQSSDLQQQLVALTKQKQEVDQRAEQIRKLVEQQQQQAEALASQIEGANQKIAETQKRSGEAKAMSEKLGKELPAKEKAVQDAMAAVEKGKADVEKRQQAFATAENAQRRAKQAIPKHKLLVATETRRRDRLIRRSESLQAASTDPGHRVVDVVVNADDSLIAAALAGGEVRLYRMADGRPMRTFVVSPDRPDGRSNRARVAIIAPGIIASSAPETPPAIWTSRSQWNLEQKIGSPEDPTVISDRVTALQFRRDGATIAVGSGPPSRTGEVLLFATESGKKVRDFGEIHSDTVLGLAFSPDGRTLASCAADKTIRLLDVASGALIRSFEGHTHHVLGVAWQDDGQTLASVSADQTVKLWNVETGQQRRTISGFSKELTAVRFVHTTNQIVTACADGQVRLYDSGNGKALRSFNAAGDFLFALAVDGEGKRVMAGGQSGKVWLWNLADGKVIHTWE